MQARSSPSGDVCSAASANHANPSKGNLQKGCQFLRRSKDLFSWRSGGGQWRTGALRDVTFSLRL